MLNCRSTEGAASSAFLQGGRAGNNEVGQLEFLMASSLVDGVILSAAVLQAERRISRYDTVCHGRSLGPLVKTRALRDDSSWISEFQTDPLPCEMNAWHASCRLFVHPDSCSLPLLFPRSSSLASAGSGRAPGCRCREFFRQRRRGRPERTWRVRRRAAWR